MEEVCHGLLEDVIKIEDPCKFHRLASRKGLHNLLQDTLYTLLIISSSNSNTDIYQYSNHSTNTFSYTYITDIILTNTYIQVANPDLLVSAKYIINGSETTAGFPLSSRFKLSDISAHKSGKTLLS